MSVQASCSRCKFTRRFADELAGRYYRCPKCRKGVISVPEVDISESEEVPLRLSSSSMESPFLAVARREPRGHEETMDTTSLGSTAEGSRLSDAVAEQAEAKARKDGRAARGEGDAEQSGSRTDLMREALSARPPKAITLEDVAPAPEKARDNTQKVEPEDHKGEVAMARRILVECGLCGFFVRIPAEFFGKTVHCPECAGNTIFSESTLDPVKDELLDRLIMETGERRVLFPEPGPDGALPGLRLRKLRRLLANNALRSFMVGVGLGLLVLLGAWFVVRSRRKAERLRVVERAESDGWRYATAVGSSNSEFHEPWCQELEHGAGLRVSEESFNAKGDDVTLHACE